MNVSVTLEPDLRLTGVGAEVLLLFVSYIFTTWNFRKIYFELPASRRASVETAVDSLFTVEGTLRNHWYIDGRWTDVLIVTLDRKKILDIDGVSTWLSNGRYDLRKSLNLRRPQALPKLETEASPPSTRALNGRRVELRSVSESDAEFLYSLSVDEEIGFRWRHGGIVLSFEEFRKQMWPGVFSQFIVRRKSSERPLGVMVGYNADLNHGFIHVGGALLPEVHRSGLAIEAFALFLQYLDRHWPLRKVYMEYPEYNGKQFFSTKLGAGLAEQARLREAVYYAGRWWDKIVVSLDMDKFVPIS